MTNRKLQTYNSSQHDISSDDIAPSARAIITRLHEHSYQAYIVGGAVRDLLLNKHPKDFDIATNATPEQIKDIFQRSCRIIGRRFRLAHVYHNREMYEVATFRGSSEGGRIVKQGHIIQDNVFGTIDQDAKRRDFTCNALYFDIQNDNILDYCNGVEHIQSKQLYFIGEDNARIIEDPIRMIRAIRFKAKLNLNLSKNLAGAIAQQHTTLKNVSFARLFDELVKLFHCGNAIESYRLMNEFSLFQHVFFEASQAINETQLNQAFVQNALKSTDARIKSGKSVTPIFLLSCFLWPLMKNLTSNYSDKGKSQYESMNLAANDIFILTRKTLSIPKIIQIGVRNIWLLQFRFLKTRGKKVFFTLEHQRFRAAYDFLLLRKDESPELQSLADWWTHIQTLSKSKQKNLIFQKKKMK